MDNIVIQKSLGSRSNPATTCADLFRTRKGLSSGKYLIKHTFEKRTKYEIYDHYYKSLFMISQLDSFNIQIS